ncbi:hypothetical protein SDC9_153118 [bioreactor metagenome]|uniref:Uncharacterized protein n=1 Tax=bioreactor metagenome TaxID=1076179 RepID=A0A645EZQ0_9ZZZZ
MPGTEKQSLHHLHLQFLVDGHAVLHCDGLVGVHSLKGDAQLGESFINLLLKWCFEYGGRCRLNFTYMEHDNFRLPYLLLI